MELSLLNLFVVHEQGPLDAFRKSYLIGGSSADGFIRQAEIKSLLTLMGLRDMALTFLLATEDEAALTEVPVHMREYVQGEWWSICHDAQDIMKQYPNMKDVSAWVHCRHGGSIFPPLTADNTDHSSWVPVKPTSSPCPYVAVRDSAQVVLLENTCTAHGILPSIRVIDRRHHEMAYGVLNVKMFSRLPAVRMQMQCAHCTKPIVSATTRLILFGWMIPVCGADVCPVTMRITWAAT